jgi:hypothetical protein
LTAGEERFRIITRVSTDVCVGHDVTTPHAVERPFRPRLDRLEPGASSASRLFDAFFFFVAATPRRSSPRSSRSSSFRHAFDIRSRVKSTTNSGNAWW